MYTFSSRETTKRLAWPKTGSSEFYVFYRNRDPCCIQVKSCNSLSHSSWFPKWSCTTWAYKSRLCLHVKANSDMHCYHMETFQRVALLCAKEHCCSSCTPALFCPTSHGPMQNMMLSVKVQCCVVHYDSVCCSMAILHSADVLCVSTMLCAEAHALSWRVGAPWEEHKSSDSPGHKSLLWNYEQLYLHFNWNFYCKDVKAIKTILTIYTWEYAIAISEQYCHKTTIPMNLSQISSNEQ